MKYVLLVVAFLVLSSSMVCGEEALSIGSDSSVLITNNLLVEKNLDVHGEIPLPPGFLFGLETKIKDDPITGESTNIIEIFPGQCRSYIGEHRVYVDDALETINTTFCESTNIVVDELSAEALFDVENRVLPVDLNAQWSEETPGRFGSLSDPLPKETYHLFVIEKQTPSGPFVSAGFDTDIDCVNRPSDYVSYRRIASIVTNALGKIVPFWQDGDRFEYEVTQLDVDFVQLQAGKPKEHDLTLPNSVTKGILLATAYISADTTVKFFYPGQPTYTPSTSATNGRHGELDYSGKGGDPGGDANKWIQRVENSQVVTISNTIPYLTIETVGWIDERGRSGGK